MVLQRDELEERRLKRNKRLRIIWLSVAGVVVLLVAFFCIYQFTDVVVGIPPDIQSEPQSAGEWPMFRRDIVHSGNTGVSAVEPQGTLKWTFSTGAAVRSSPAVVNGTVYFGSRDYHIYAVDAATGELKWSYKTGSWVDSSPIVSGGVVYCGSNDSNLYALDAETGEFIWSFDADYAVRSTPAVCDGIVYVGSDNYWLYALDAETGALVWKTKTGAVVNTSPLVSEGFVVLGAPDGECYTFNSKTGGVRLKYLTTSYIRSSPVVADGVIYFMDTSGYFYAVDLKARNWLWEHKIRFYWNVLHVYGLMPKAPDPSGFIWVTSLGYGIFTGSSLSLGDNHVYFGLDDDVISLDLDTHEVQWKFTTGDMVISSPALAAGAIYVGGEDGYLYALDKATGAIVWDYNLGDVITSSPAIDNGVLFIGCDDGNLYAFE